MSFSIGLVGLPNAGKSTIFNALSKGSAQTADYAFTTIDPNVARVTIPDERLDSIAQIVKPPKLTKAILECVDIAGLVEGASKGEGLGNKFLEHIRQVDAVAHIIRCFRNDNISHESGEIDPEKDLALIETELLLADLEVVSKRFEKVEKSLKVDTKEIKLEHDFLGRLKGSLEKGDRALGFSIKNEDERAIYKTLNLLTSKPSIYIGNIPEKRDENLIDKAKTAVQSRGSELILIDGLLEGELGDVSDEEKDELLSEYGWGESSLKRLLVSAYKSLNLITFYTIKGDETRAWVLEKGQSALQAAEKIHSDIAAGFIKAEIAPYVDFIKEASFDGVKKAGKLIIAGKDHTIEDGQMVLFKFK